MKNEERKMLTANTNDEDVRSGGRYAVDVVINVKRKETTKRTKTRKYERKPRKLQEGTVMCRARNYERRTRQALVEDDSEESI